MIGVENSLLLAGRAFVASTLAEATLLVAGFGFLIRG